MLSLKVAALVLVFVAGVLLAPELIDILRNYLKKERMKLFSAIFKKILQIPAWKRQQRLNDQIIEGLEVLSNSLKSGFSIFQGLNLLSEEMPPPISEEFRLVIQEMKLGLSLESALKNLSKRVKSEELNIVITAIEISQETGGSLSEALTRVAYTIRERKKIIEKTKALTSQARMQALIVGLLPVLLITVIFLIDPQFIMPLFLTPPGWIMLGIAAGMEIAGIIVIRRITRMEI